LVVFFSGTLGNPYYVITLLPYYVFRHVLTELSHDK
jgi:hypothetical protein